MSWPERTRAGPAEKPKTTDLTKQERIMFINPQISKQLADEHRRDLLADAQVQSFARKVQAESGTARYRQPLTYRLWRRLRPVSSPVSSQQLSPEV
jgi:hypothetical protein